MPSLTELLQYVRHMGDYLDLWSGQLGPWFYAVMFLVIFCETGLVVTPFLPGDSLLFALGALCARPATPLSMHLLLILLLAAAVLGDAVNYAIGLRLGPAVFRFESSWLLNKKHLLRAQAFYEKHGSKTIILARFVPIVRTFAPFVAGIGKMLYRKFFVYNVVGGLAWVAICLYSGFFFGHNRWVTDHFEIVLIAIIIVSVLPMGVELLLAWFKKTPPQTESSDLPGPAMRPLAAVQPQGSSAV